MIQNYLKVALRNLFKNKLYSFINIVGLGVAIAVSVTGYISYQFSQSYDSFHENAERIFLVNSYRINNNHRQNFSNSPTPLAPAIKENIPGIAEYVRIARGSGILRFEEKVFDETLFYVDDSFFEVFTFTMPFGTKDALKDNRGLVISEEIAHKYFGDEEPIGKQVILSPDGENEYVFFIRGVISKPSVMSSLQLTVCVPYINEEDMFGYNHQSWKDWTGAAFIQISNEASASRIEEQLQSYIPQTNEANENFQINGFYLTPLPQLSSTTRALGGNIFFPGWAPPAIIMPSVVTLLVLLLACFNFINTAVAFASKRHKEIGVRKVIGGVRSQLIKQFLGENLVLCFIALLSGMFLAKIFVTVYDALWPEVAFSLNYTENLGVVGFLIGLLIFMAVAAGAYPAFYISKFNPVTIFRGRQKLGGTNPLIRILLTLQFAISISAILSGIILYQNSEFINNHDLGFDKEQILVVPVKGAQNYDLLKDAIESHPDIVSIGGSQHLMGRDWTRRDIEVDQKTKTRTPVFEIGENYLQTAGIELISGREFNHNLKTDINQSVIVNETLEKTFGWVSALGKYIKFKTTDSEKEYRVIGVVKDFHYDGLWEKVEPMVLRLAPPERYRYLSIKFNRDNLTVVSTYLQNTWKQLFPHLPYDGFFQTEILAEAAHVNESVKLMFLYIAVIVVITSGMGLFALVSLNIAKRTKEIGIRKILGASLVHISSLISKEFILLMLIASVLASIMGYFMITAFMSSVWAYYVDFGVVPFIVSALLMFVIALMTVSSKVFSVVKSNPVEAIRNE